MMKRLLILSLLAAGCYHSASAQERPIFDFGNVTLREVVETNDLARYKADAVVIHELGLYVIEDLDARLSGVELNSNVGGQRKESFYKEVVTKIKVLTPEGARYGVVEIPYYFSGHDPDKVFAEGFVYKLNSVGEFETEKLTDITDVEVGENRRVKRLVFPNVREGSIIELRYTHRATIRENKNLKEAGPYNLSPWVFQRDIPVLLSQLEYWASPYYSFTYILKGASKFDIFNSRMVSGTPSGGYSTDKTSQVLYTFGMKNVPPVVDTDLLPNIEDHIIRLDFELSSKLSRPQLTMQTYLSTWGRLNDDFMDDSAFGKYINAATKESSKILPGILSDGMSDDDKLKAITDYVRRTYSWNGTSGKFASGRLSSFLKSREGNSADINLFLMGLLRGAGFDVTPVAVSSVNHGKIYKKYPFSQFLDYVVAQVTVAGKVLYLDATDKHLPYDKLPARIANVEGLLVIPDVEKWVTVKYSQVAFSDKQATVTVNPATGMLAGKATILLDGEFAREARAKFGASENAELVHAAGDYSVSGVSAENYGDVYKPLTVHYSYSCPVEITPEGMSIDPLYGFAPTSNPFGKSVRKLPVDLVFNHIDRYQVRFTIPEGYEVAAIPANKVAENAIATTTYNVTREGDDVVVTASFTLKKTAFAPGEYFLLKNVYHEMLATFSQKIVLTKK